ncbi:hypothetical protein ETH_00016470 [Eimeria tenella]|uniref:Uncharacterized protein n=1 Tax=Eimeria tenella TaxID=5802 RepID=U6KMY3_EIMTE|nr:hypothetical protein ETH_00016470 [Eimeria tenella]CDJ37647.1 hypothetical protein ETH_00016470 [Eimeria tenella]|eukprot:XP_013228485.1 hypothetical protein ETH_00016470 [Eimeria tenella]
MMHCSCRSSDHRVTRYLVLPPPPPDEDETRETFRTSLFRYLGLEIQTVNDPSPSSSVEQIGSLSSCTNGPKEKTKELRLLRICTCLCDWCVRVSCGAWLDALRVNNGSDSDLYFFEGHLQRPPETDKNDADRRGSENRKGGKSVTCYRLAEGRGKETRGDAWGLLAGCAMPFSYRHCLGIMQKPFRVMLKDQQDQWTTNDEETKAVTARYAAQARRLFSLFCSPANTIRGYTPHEGQTATFRSSAAEIGAYIHPGLKVAHFDGEGRGLVAAEDLRQGDLLLRLPASALLNVYTALAHPTFSPLAQVLLGLPPEHLQPQSAEVAPGTAKQRQESDQHKEQPIEVQPLVDCDVVVCLFLLFLAFTSGEEGGRALLRFLPPAGSADAAVTAEALYRCAAAAKATENGTTEEAMFLNDAEKITEFLGDAALTDAVNRTLAKCRMMQQELVPLLQQTFPPISGEERRGVLAACRAAAAAGLAASKNALSVSSVPAGAVAAAAEVAAASGTMVAPALKGMDLLKAFLSQLSYEDFLWAHFVLDSRSFSLPVEPDGLLDQVSLVEDNSSRPCPNVEANKSQDEGEEESQETFSVPFLPDVNEVAPVKDSRPVFLQAGASGGAARPFLVRVPARCASLVPLGELLNHHYHGQVLSPAFEGDERSLCLRLACDVPAGAQVYAHYGPLQSWQFLAYFGFCPRSFPVLQPNQKNTQVRLQAEPQETNAENEWLFTGESAGNPMDFLTIQVEVPEDDAEHGLKNGLIELHGLPYCGLFCTGIESVSWKFLASLFVTSHVSLDDFIVSGGNGGSAGPAAAALEADEKVWGPTTRSTGRMDEDSGIGSCMDGALAIYASHILAQPDSSCKHTNDGTCQVYPYIYRA